MSYDPLKSFVTTEVWRYQCKKDTDGNYILPYQPDLSTESHVEYSTSYYPAWNAEGRTPSTTRDRPDMLLSSLTSCGPHWREFCTIGHAIEETWPMGHVPGSFPPVFERKLKHHRPFYGPVSLPAGGDVGDLPTRHRLKVRDAVLDLSSLFAELDESADTFRKVAGGLTAIANKVRSKKGRRELAKTLKSYNYSRVHQRGGRSGTAKQLAYDVASTNLAIQFGIKPLIQDAYNLVQTMANRHDRGEVRRISSSATEVLQGQSGYKGKAKHTYISYVSARLNGSPYTVGNPIEWIWERIPFSFIVDYVVGVGDYLRSMYIPPQVNHLGTTLTVRKEIDVDYAPPAGATVVVAPKAVTESYHRVVVDLPDPAPPEWDPTRSLQALGNAVSTLIVVSSIFSGRAPRSLTGL